ncbi:MAG: TolC family protein [Ignavibacteriaceae bacterium]|nr:TolC family protein [Ignavibacteriaceae bacterium]
MALILVSLLPRSTYSQDKLMLTLDKAVETGLANNKNLKIAYYGLKGAEAKLNETGTSRLPSLSASLVYTRLSEVDPFILATPFGTFDISPSILNSYTSKLTLTQPIFTGFKLNSAINLAEIGVENAKEDFNKNRDDVVLNVKSAYWNMYKAKQFAALLDENIQQINARLKDAKNLFDQGLITRNDVLKLEVQLSDILYRKTDADNAAELAKLALNNAMGLPLITETDITDKAEVSEMANINLTDLINTAKTNRPEIKSAGLRMKAGETNITMAKSGWYPQVAAVGNYNYARPNQRIFPTKDEFKGTWDLSLSVSFNIWNWMATSYQTEQAEVQLEQAKDGYRSVEDLVVLDVTQSYLGLKQANNKVKISELGVKQAAENYRLTSDRFKQGLVLSADVIDAEVALLQAKTNLNNSTVDYMISLAKLNRAIGKQ